MARENLLSSFCVSLSLHLTAILLIQLAQRLAPPNVSFPIAEPLTIEIGYGSPAPPPGAIARGPVARPAPPRPQAVAKPPARVEGVRLASRDDIRRKLQNEASLAPTTPDPAPVTGDSAPTADAAPDPPAAGAPSGTVEEGAAVASTGDGPRWGNGRGSGFDRGAPGGRYSPDTPGWTGRIFGQVSVRATSAHDSVYGRIHLFAEDDFHRDYSHGSVFGYSFRQELPGGAVRDFQVGRVQTHGAYLVVTDLFANGRISTMSHTVVIAFPRRAPTGGDLYEVAEEPSGDFRLRGPDGSWLLFDGRSGALREASGFSVRPPGETGSFPRVGYRGLHVRIHSVGGNPFLRGRAATVVDARGGRCDLSTSDLFAYPDGKRESDMFRFASDREFFSFLGSRCPWLDLPRPAEPRMVAAEPTPDVEPPSGSGGLIPSLFRRLR